ncbi:GNAT family N-acetyltransferase [Flagellimonas sp. DF-77]|uniref:GNAT family N-acetyltransferase n=1 Tax=Flagellimonas algarum TaxID=3230298 RepID=UPI003393655F
MIRRAKIPEIDDILAITRACARFMSANGIDQWNEHYPSRSAFETDLAQEALFVKIENSELIGAIVVSEHMDAEYHAIDWLTENDRNAYIHRVCIHPDHQGKGHARQLMDFAEQQARRMGCVSVRLDTFSLNTRNQRFYEARGYHRLGDVYFPKQSEAPFHCYELLL